MAWSSVRLPGSALSAALWLGACAADVSGGFAPELGAAIQCGFDYSVRIEADDGQVQALVRCRGGGDCGDRRTVQRGARLDLLIELPGTLEDAEVEVHSSDSMVMHIEGFDARVPGCSEGGALQGTASFEAVGDSALAVAVDGQVIDRFTASVHEPAGIAVVASEGLYLGGGPDGNPVERLELDAPYTLRAIVHSAEGDRLVGGPGFEWTLDDSDVAELIGGDGSSATTPSVWLNPVAIGETTLRVQSDALRASLSIEVTGVQARASASSAAVPSNPRP